MSAAHRFAEKACTFLTASTDPFHVVKNAVLRLEAAGFQPLTHANFASNQITAGGKYYYTVHHSTLVAFTVGSQYQPGGSGFHIIGGHTDSPNLSVKPRSQKPHKNGCIQLAVQCYGGGLWHTWFDRDLSISGKVLVRQDDDGKVHTRLVQLSDPVARVSTLCIHLQTPDERAAFKVNAEDHTAPIIGTVNKELEESVAQQIGSDTWKQGQEPLLLKRIAEEMQVSVDQIADFELSLHDTQPAKIGGINNELLFSARLDNLATVFCAVEALSENNPANQQDIKMIVCFDHEEVGSVSTHGAGSPIMEEAVRRVSAALGVPGDPELQAQTIANSFILSIDQAHAVHPNYASKHDSQHAPLLNGGLVIKTNCNQRYATNGFTGFVVRELGRKIGVPVQEFAGTLTSILCLCVEIAHCHFICLLFLS